MKKDFEPFLVLVFMFALFCYSIASFSIGVAIVEFILSFFD
jgi:hypothetical protein